MVKSTEQLIKIFEELKIKYRVDEGFAQDTDVISVRLKHGKDFTDFAVFIADSQPDASIQAIMGKTTPEQRPVCLEILNELHQKQKIIKYTIDHKNLICAQLDIIADEKFLPSIVFQLMCNSLDLIIQCKSLLSQSGVLICTNKKKT